MRDAPSQLWCSNFKRLFIHRLRHNKTLSLDRSQLKHHRNISSHRPRPNSHSINRRLPKRRNPSISNNSLRLNSRHISKSKPIHHRKLRNKPKTMRPLHSKPRNKPMITGQITLQIDKTRQVQTGQIVALSAKSVPDWTKRICDFQV